MITQTKRLVIFLGVTFIFSWFCWFLVPLAGLTGMVKQVVIVLGILGPALGAYAASQPLKSKNNFSFVFWAGLNLLIGLSYYLRASRSALTENQYDLNAFLQSPVSIILVALDIIVAAWLFLKLSSEETSPKSKWYVLAIVFFPLLMVMVGLICNLTGLPVGYSYTSMPFITLIISVVFAFPCVLFLNAGIEELGWRGFLQTWFEKKSSPARSALMVGIIWGVWHFPLHIIGFYAGGSGIMSLVTRLVISISLSIILAWFYKKSNRSVLVVMVLHTLSNICVMVFPQNGLVWIVLLILSAVAFFIGGKMWRKPLANGNVLDSNGIIAPLAVK